MEVDNNNNLGIYMTVHQICFRDRRSRKQHFNSSGTAFFSCYFFFVSSLFSSLLAILFFLFQDNKAELIKQAPGHISRNSCTLALLVGKEVAYL